MCYVCISNLNLFYGNKIYNLITMLTQLIYSIPTR